MTTFRELEAMVAAVDMGSFKGAARALNTSQSAVSRLIQDFEGQFALPLFSRDQRAAQLTLAGQEALRVARSVLRQRATLMERFCSAELVSPALRLGVTELAAMTWLPGFVAQLRARYPKLHLDVEVGASPQLHEKVRTGRLGVAVVIDVIRTTEMARIPIGAATMGWYSAPGLLASQTLSMAQLEAQTLLIQGSSTGVGRHLAAWFKALSFEPVNIIQSDSLIALAGMAAAGLGVANLPTAFAFEAVRSGRIEELRLPQAVPEAHYVALTRVDSASAFHRAVIEMARDSCDFDQPFHALPRASGAAAC